MKKLGIFLIFLWCFSGTNAQVVGEFNFNDNTGELTTTELLSKTAFDIKNHFKRPERITGVTGNALRLDGWSTWAEASSFKLPNLDKQISISTWYATEAFTARNASIVQQEGNSKGFSLQVSSFGNVLFTFWADGLSKVVTSKTQLKKYQWNYIVATADLNTGIAKIYINGEEDNALNFGAANSTFLQPDATMYIGRHAVEQTFAGFLINVLNGAIDELKIHKNALNLSEIQANYQQHKDKIPDLSIDPDIRHANDYLRPRYHAMPNTSWTNEPYGLIHYKNKYHLFFQKNPNGPYLYFMHWGHLTSPDLVNWKEEKIALAPKQGFDNFGKWSGTSILDPDGKPALVFTGVNGAKAGMGVAFPSDSTMENWTEYSGNPVVAAPPASYSTMDFRDPYVWKEGEIYYMIVGSGLQNNGGGILFTYKSKDLKTWLSTAPIYQNNNVAQCGVFWEMPFFYKINDKDYILQITPTPHNGKRAKSIYWVGKFENDKFVPYFSEPKPLEYINEKMLAPAIGKDENDRATYIGIIPEDRDVNDQIKAGWRQIFSLPRVVRLLKDSTLGQVPHPNLCRLRNNPVEIKNRKISVGTTFNLPEIQGTQTELQFNIKADKNAKFLIQVFKNPNLSEFTTLEFDLKNNRIALNREKSTQSPAAKTQESVPYIFNPKDTIKASIFLDHSVLEVFIENVVVFSARVYPSQTTSNKIDLLASEGNIELLSLFAWQMKDMKSSNTLEVCEIPTHELPQRLRTLKDLIATKEQTEVKKKFSINPTLTNDIISVTYLEDGFPSDVYFNLYNIEGRQVEKSPLTENKNITLSHLKSGIYIAVIKVGNDFQHFKIIKE
jgi:beta-fructofuranosidase